MNFLNKIKRSKRRNENVCSMEDSVGGGNTHFKEESIDSENVRFMEDSVGFFFAKSTRDLLDEDFLYVVSDKLNVLRTTIEQTIKGVIEDMIDDVVCCVEYPYVEAYYRDTYYTFYSRKHFSYGRNCFRISFFAKGVTREKFHLKENLSQQFYGYIVLRPTPARPLGYSFLSPRIYKEHNFSCCMYQKRVSIYGRKLVVKGFPFSGQDDNAISCAETSLMILLDYFSHKYHKYSHLLPSRLVDILSEQTFERMLPSRGLTPDSIAFVLCRLGFGVRVYAQKSKKGQLGVNIGDVYEKEEFKRLLYIHIESGFPLLACTEDHSFLIVGRENKLGTDAVQLVVMDDNARPYKMISYDTVNIVSFMVPLHEKIHVEAEMINLDEVISSVKTSFENISIPSGSGYLVRGFLTTSRAYKEYVVNQNPTKPCIDFVYESMPHFIWVYEIIEKKKIVSHDIKETIVDSVFIFDATAGKESIQHLIMMRRPDWIIMRTQKKVNKKNETWDEEGQCGVVFGRIDKNTGVFHIFTSNLKMEDGWRIP